MQTILIPTDFSENSWNAIAYAVALYKEVPCNFYLLHVGNLRDSNIISNTFSFPKEMESPNIKKKLDTLFDRIQDLPITGEHHFIALQEYGNFINVIRRTVIAKKIDLIVMGTRGATGATASIIGSNTGDVITKVACNVLVVPEKASLGPPKKIAFPTDYNIFYSFKILNVLTALLNLSKAELDVLHVSRGKGRLTRPQEKNKRYLEDYLSEILNSTHNHHRVTDKNIKLAIQSFVAEKKVDMLVMVAKNLNFFQQLLFDTTIEKLSFHTHIPLLVLHE